LRALVVDPGAPSNVRWGEVPEPVPEPDQPLVEVHHLGVNYAEVMLDVWPAGSVHGHDASGIVVRAAADGAGPPVGTKVALGFARHAWAERVAAPRKSLAVVPDGVELADAAALSIAGLTALRVMRSRSLLGRRVLVSGASGGVGRFGIQLAAIAGANVTALTGNPAQGDALRRLGADRVVADVGELERGFDLVLDTVAGPFLERVWPLLAAGGTIHTVGQASQQPTTFATGALFGLGQPRTIATAGIGDPARPGTADDGVSEDLTTMLEFLSQGRLSSEIGWRGSWRELDDAVEALRRRSVTGKIVLDVD
jgi:NADPH:quinone reductase